MADYFQVGEKSTSAAHGTAYPTKPIPLEPKRGPPSYNFNSRRSPLICTNGAVASSQPLASQIGLDILKKGGNAADAAVAVAAALAVTEPCSTGLGGDMFALYYEASTKTVQAINGSGKSSHSATLENYLAVAVADSDFPGEKKLPKFHAMTVTVPGAAKGWEDVHNRWGTKLEESGSAPSISFADLLEPAASLSEGGFPVQSTTSWAWHNGIPQIRQWSGNGSANAVDGGGRVPFTCAGSGQPPREGELFSNPDLAATLRELGAFGAGRFYEGRVGKEIVKAVTRHGGLLEEIDLISHKSSFPQPISASYMDHDIWEIPPNGQGIGALVGLESLKEVERVTKLPLGTDENERNPKSASALHAMIECMRLGFGDIKEFVGDGVDSNSILDVNRIKKRVKDCYDDTTSRCKNLPGESSCTVSFQVVDQWGNAISFVNSNYMGFGTGIVPANCGFCLQNRGFGFSLEKSHPNCVGPAKRPLHTIIPCMVTTKGTRGGDFVASISNMGGNMQPQGHMQLVVNLLKYKMDVQSAVDWERFCIRDGSRDGDVFLEEGSCDEEAREELRRMGHKIGDFVTGLERGLFGKAQIIKRGEDGVIWCGSDGRCDGMACGY